MRFASLNAIVLLASLAAASGSVSHDHISEARVQRNSGSELDIVDAAKSSWFNRRWCILFIFGDTCFASSSTTSAAPASSTSTSTTVSNPSTPSATRSVTQTPTATATSTGPSPTSVVPSVTATPSAPPNSTTDTGSTSTFVQSSKSFSYSQPPLPARTISAPYSVFTPQLGGIDPIFAQTRYYNLVMEYAAGAPSGFHRRMSVINGQYPAPMIEGYQGDTLVITVQNKLDHPQSIHWHGMRQNYSNWADGVPGISQCSIPAGGSFTYRIKLDTEVGTYWPYKKFQAYDAERMIYLADWQNDQSEIIAEGLLDLGKTYRGSNIPPDPDAILINGKGQSDCLVAQAGVKCVTTDPSVTKVVSGNRVRFRIINHGAHATLRFSIDKHTLSLIEIDDTSIKPIDVHEVTLAPGQRASVIVKMNQGMVGDAFWMRATTASACLNPRNVITNKAILWYTDFLGLTWFGSGIPKTEKWGDLHDPATAPCLDTDQEHHIVPAVVENSPATAVEAKSLHSSVGQFVHPDGTAYIGFGYNSVAFTNYINNPLLSQVEKGLELNPKHIAALTFNSPGSAYAVDFIINNLDPFFLAHPFHLHGRPFHIIARGKGVLEPEDIPHQSININNPPRRDTLVIGGGEWALLRIITDNPGVWPIHCHIGWHLAVGKLGVFIIRPDEVQKFSQPADWSNLCNGLDPNEIGPARKRSIPPQRRGDYNLIDEDEVEMFEGGVQDFTPTPPGTTRAEYRSNGTHWWVQGTSYAGEIPEEHQVPEKRHVLESRTVFMNETDWWIPGTVFHGKLNPEFDLAKQQAANKQNPDSGVIIVTPELIVPGPGDALVEPAEIIGGTVVLPDPMTFENSLRPGFTPTGGKTPDPTGPSPNGGSTNPNGGGAAHKRARFPVDK